MHKKAIMLAISSLTIFYFTTHIIVETLYERQLCLLLLLGACSIPESIITSLIANKILSRKEYFSYGIVFLVLYMLLLLIGYIAFRTAAYSLEFSEKYWIYFPSLLSEVYMPLAVGGHLLTLYLLSKRKHN